MQKDYESNKYVLWLLPLHFRYMETKERIYKKELQNYIDFVADVMLVYNLLRRIVDKLTLQKFEDFFNEIFKESACYGNSSIEVKATIDELKRQFPSIINNKDQLIKKISSLTYSKYSQENDLYSVRFILRRLNEQRGNHLLDYKGSIEHIIEDNAPNDNSSKLGNLIYLESNLNTEAGNEKIIAMMAKSYCKRNLRKSI